MLMLDGAAMSLSHCGQTSVQGLCRGDKISCGQLCMLGRRDRGATGYWQRLWLLMLAALSGTCVSLSALDRSAYNSMGLAERCCCRE